MPALKMKSAVREFDCHAYIAANDRFLSSAILYTVLPGPDGDRWLGAYYGYIGGGENDGGYFRIDMERGVSEHLDYDGVERLSLVDPDQSMILESVMQVLWTLIDEDQGILALTDVGLKYYQPDDDGIWMDDEFNGDCLDEISHQWRIRLRFES